MKLVYVNHEQIAYEREMDAYMALVEQGHCIGCLSSFAEYVNCDGRPLCADCGISEGE